MAAGSVLPIGLLVLYAGRVMTAHGLRPGSRAQSRATHIMFNPQPPRPEVSTRSLVFRQALAAAFKSRRQNIPAAPESLPALLAACERGVVAGPFGKPGCRDALSEIRARLFHDSGPRCGGARLSGMRVIRRRVFAARVARLNGQPWALRSWAGCCIERAKRWR